MTDQEKTISAIERTMREWIEAQISVYEKMPAAQTMTTTQGERVLKNNPAVQEIRAAFKDYCYVCRVQRELSDAETPADITPIEELRKRFKVV